MTQKGFTLIELLIVIAIVAILSVVVILTLNPAELLKQTRDSNRISDLSTLKTAIGLYVADVTFPNLFGSFANDICFVSTSTSLGNCNAPIGGAPLFVGSVAENASTSRDVNGSGWLPVNFTQISSGVPLGNLPVDPVNNDTYFYAYFASSTSLTFEINAHMESDKFKNGGGADVESTDGGSKLDEYEAGTAPGLSL